MVTGWVTLESLVKKVYPEPDLGKVLRAKVLIFLIMDIIRSITS
ncbi:hypothetical protein [Bacillus sp. TH50]|nr:hypothetical protein [Bacillus sp. TH50]